MKPKIFLVVEGQRPWVYGYALAEDGTWLTSHASSSRQFARNDLQTSVKKTIYDQHYPAGYLVVDYLDDSPADLEHRDDYTAALMRSDALPGDEPIRLRENAA